MADKEYIEREAARKFLAQVYTYAAADLLKFAPAADVVEVRRGEWIRDEQSYFYHRYNCSACGYRHLGEPTKFCGECGADMRGELK